MLRIQTLLFTLIRIRIMLFNLKRIQIQLFDLDTYPFKEVMYLKKYFLILTWFSSSVGPTGPNQKAYFVKFSLPVNYVVLIKVGVLDPDLDPRTSRNGSWILILENYLDPYGSGSATLGLGTVTHTKPPRWEFNKSKSWLELTHEKLTHICSANSSWNFKLFRRKQLHCDNRLTER